jgi:hypothetical protein
MCEDPGILLRGFVPLTIKVPNINQDYVIISSILHNISILENPIRFVFIFSFLYLYCVILSYVLYCSSLQYLLCLILCCMIVRSCCVACLFFLHHL